MKCPECNDERRLSTQAARCCSHRATRGIVCEGLPHWPHSKRGATACGPWSAGLPHRDSDWPSLAFHSSWPAGFTQMGGVGAGGHTAGSSFSSCGVASCRLQHTRLALRQTHFTAGTPILHTHTSPLLEGTHGAPHCPHQLMLRRTALLLACPGNSRQSRARMAVIRPCVRTSAVTFRRSREIN